MVESGLNFLPNILFIYMFITLFFQYLLTAYNMIETMLNADLQGEK